MLTAREAGASVLLKNTSGGDYAVAELGGTVVADDATIDLMDDELDVFYDNYNMAKDLVTRENQSQLWADIQAGDIEVVSTTPPRMPRLGAAR